jgi:hypothetical protein
MLIFVEGGKPENPEKNPARERTNNQLNSHEVPEQRAEDRTYFSTVFGN